MSTDPDVSTLIQRFERGIVETTDKFRSQGMMIVIGSGAMAGLAALRQIWFLVPVCGAFGLGIWFLMRAAAKNSGPERAAPVLEALRRAPGRITLVAHRETSDSKRLFVTHWVEVLSDDGGRIYVRADDDWRLLLERLSRLCPQAKLQR